MVTTSAGTLSKNETFFSQKEVFLFRRPTYIKNVFNFNKLQTHKQEHQTKRPE